MIRRARLAVSAILLAGATAGCSQPPYFVALTTPPPFTHAELCDQCDEGAGGMTITLTQGVALAFECFDSVTAEPCGNVQATPADPSIALAFNGYLDTLAPATSNLGLNGIDGATAEAVLVVVGTKVGETTLAYSSANGDATFDVSVVPP